MEPTEQNNQDDLFSPERERLYIRDLRTASQVHRQSMRDPRYAIAYLTGWPKNQLEIAMLRRKVRR